MDKNYDNRGEEINYNIYEEPDIRECEQMEKENRFVKNAVIKNSVKFRGFYECM